MTAPHVLDTSPDTRRVEQHGGRDRLLDVIRAAALARVVLWHTWSWWWLSWIPAMPAMFFAGGALLEDSVGRRGALATLRQRLRRLLLPLWAYGAACWTLMLADGWRPAGRDLLAWMLPIVDPVGSATTPGLWVPLWYVRAYLWFVLAAGALHLLVRRLGWASVGLAAAGPLAVELALRAEVALPLAVADAVVYLPFVLAGMCCWRLGPPQVRFARLLGLAGALVALAWWVRLGPPDGVVNRSYGLTAVVGLAGVAAALAVRDRLAVVGGRTGRAVDLLGRRALTIYLWHGLGLEVAHRVTVDLDAPWLLTDLVALAAVVGVPAAATVTAGPLEDRAAGRPPTAAPWPCRLGAVVAVAVSVALVAMAAPAADRELPLSGAAVVARAEQVQEALAGGRAERPAWAEGSPTEIVEQWSQAHEATRAAVGLTRLRAAIVDGDGRTRLLTWSVEDGAELVELRAGERGPVDDRLAWWSMTKAVTVVWLLRSQEAGVVELDDRLSRWVPEVPNAERITLEDLARHASGISRDAEAELFEATPAGDIERYVEDPRLLFEPGTGFHYSRVGYQLLALALERANGRSWRSAVEELAEQAGVRLRFDEDDTPFDDVTDPDGRGYRGGLWASGGIVSSVVDGARFVHWVFTEGLAPASLDRMAAFDADPNHQHYGLGLLPVCPCRLDAGVLRAERWGLDAASGSFVVDPQRRVALMIEPDAWFGESGPVPALYELQRALLDAG